MTTIAWTRNDDGTDGKSWNPVRGCRQISPGCGDPRGGGCYAMGQAHRFSGPGQPYEGLTKLTKLGPRWTGRAVFVPKMLSRPLRWRKPQRVFVNSMSDLWHDDITDSQIAAVFGVMAACPQHEFIVLTKRANRMRQWFDWAHDQRGHGNTTTEVMRGHAMTWMPGVHAADGSVPPGPGRALLGFDRRWPLPNVVLGISAENQEAADERLPYVLQSEATCRMVSLEPMIGPLVLRAPEVSAWPEKTPTHPIANPEEWDDWKYWCARDRGVNVVVVGGESGPGARPCHISWIRDIVRQCKEAGVCVFVKQLGANAIGDDGKPYDTEDPKGGDMSEWPADLQVRQWPKVNR